EDALLRFVRRKLARVVSDKRDQCLESLLSFRYTRLDIERFHGDPPDVANHWNTAQMFPGFYHIRRVPYTQKPSSHATLTLNSYRVRSTLFALNLSLFV